MGMKLWQVLWFTWCWLWFLAWITWGWVLIGYNLIFALLSLIVMLPSFLRRNELTGQIDLIT